MKHDDNNPMWVERYRPRTVADIILPADTKQQFLNMVKSGDIPTNLLLAGGPGIGKTTTALAMLREIDADHLLLNGSLHGNIDTLRTRVTDFATSVSFGGRRKFVVLDEADYLTAATQPALRQFMEEYSSNCGFILTCNWIKRIIEPLRGRCTTIEFNISRDEAPAIKGAAFERITGILGKEGVKYDPAVVAHVLEKYFPDLRRCINQLQGYSNGGPIDSGILARLKDTSIETLVGHMRKRDYTEVRKWVGLHAGDFDGLYRKIYDTCHEFVDKSSIPQLVVHIGTYQYRAAFASDPEVNMAACLAEIMCSCQFVDK